MLTRCPACAAWFRVRAEHLSAAAGYVTCGACDTVFNALATLAEEAPSAFEVEPPAAVPPAAATSPPAQTREQAKPAPTPIDHRPPTTRGGEVTAPADARGEPDSAFWREVIERHDREQAALHAVDPPGADAPPPLADDAIAARPARVADSDAVQHEGPAPAAVAGDAPEQEPGERAIPEVLRSELFALEREQQRRARRGRLWALACAVLGLALLAQIAFVHREWLVAHWPAAAPWAARACAVLGCPHNEPEPATATPVELVARDVREHPQYHDALLVNATLVNSGASPTPFPVLELVLHDTTGQIIGARRFAPEEYLDHSIPIAAGMPPAQPIYIVIELGGTAVHATSFEFSFL